MTTSPASSADARLFERVSENVRLARRRIADSSPAPEQVRIVAVTKTFGPQAVRAAVAAGIETVGENYLVELETKRRALSDLAVRWHFLGALQSNKIARATRAADVLCGVARAKEVARIASLAPASTIYVEVDVSDIATRSGASVSMTTELVLEARRLGLDVRGLMTVAPPTIEGARRAFKTVRELADQLGVVERSMGMSDDLELACEYGSTEVRLGRALFGSRVAA